MLMLMVSRKKVKGKRKKVKRRDPADRYSQPGEASARAASVSLPRRDEFEAFFLFPFSFYLD